MITPKPKVKEGKMLSRLRYMPTRLAILTKVKTRNARLHFSSSFFRNYPPQTDATFIDRRVVLSKNFRYFYLHLPKSASSSIISNLYYGEFGAWPTKKQPKDLSQMRFSKLSQEELEEVLASYFVFTLVRNPYTRLASAYLDKVANPHRSPIGPEWERRRRLAQYLGKKPTDEISFTTFLDFLEFGDGVHGDSHWAPQSALLGLPVTRFGFIGALETIDADLPFIMQRIFGKAVAAKKVAPHATDAGRFAAALTDRERERIYRLYEADFDNFGYAKGDATSPPARRTTASPPPLAV